MKGANSGSDDQKSITGNQRDTCANAKWSLPNSSYCAYMMAWRPKIGLRDDDFLSPITKRDRWKNVHPFLDQWDPPPR
jgi:hypothetical protein